MKRKYLTLGRFGDLCTTLQMAYLDHQQGHEVSIVTTPEFAPLLEGCSYVTAIQCNVHYGDQARARHMHPDAIPASWYGSGLPMEGESYQKQAWSIAKKDEQFGTAPLVFDNRNEEREALLLKAILDNTHPGKPIVLVAGKGVSSPLPNSLFERLHDDLLGCDVVNLDTIQAERPYDMLALLDRADCLVTIDSLFLHLARASKCPVVSILNSGWRGSVPPPTSVAEHRYESLNEQAVVDDVARILKPHGRTVLVIDAFGKEKRHREAKKTWEQFDVVLADSKWKRNATMIGNARPLPFMKDLLERALSVAENNDVICTTNDDCQIGDISEIVRHAHRFGAVSVRRDERDGTHHIGREFYAFSAEWLRNHLQEFPDVILCMPFVDLIVARFIRSKMRIRTTGAPKVQWSESNLQIDIFPAELPKGAIYHDPHQSSWTEDCKTPAYRWNARLWENWQGVY